MLNGCSRCCCLFFPFSKLKEETPPNAEEADYCILFALWLLGQKQDLNLLQAHSKCLNSCTLCNNMAVTTSSHQQAGKAPGGGGLSTYSNNYSSKNELDDIDVIPKGKVLSAISNFSPSSKSPSFSNGSPGMRKGWSPRSVQTRSVDGDQVGAVNKQEELSINDSRRNFAVVTPTGPETIGNGRHVQPPTHASLSTNRQEPTGHMFKTLPKDSSTQMVKPTVPITPDEKGSEVPASTTHRRNDMQTKLDPKHIQRKNDEANAPRTIGSGIHQSSKQKSRTQLQNGTGYVPVNNTQNMSDPSQFHPKNHIAVNIFSSHNRNGQNTRPEMNMGQNRNIAGGTSGHIDQNVRPVTTMQQSTTNAPSINHPRQNTGSRTNMQTPQNQVNVADSQPRNGIHKNSRNTIMHHGHNNLNSHTSVSLQYSNQYPKQQPYRIPKETSPLLRARIQQVHQYGQYGKSVVAPNQGSSPPSRTPRPMQAQQTGKIETPPTRQFPPTISPGISTPTHEQGGHPQQSTPQEPQGINGTCARVLPPSQSSVIVSPQPEVSPLTRTPNTTGQYTDPSMDFGSDVEFADFGHHSPSTYDSRSFREFESKIVKSMKNNFKDELTTDADSMASNNEDDYSYDTSRFTDASSYYSTRYEFVESSFPLSNPVDYMFDDNSLIASDQSSCRRPRRKNKRNTSRNKKAEALKREKQIKGKVPKKAPRKPPIQRKKQHRRNHSAGASVKTEASVSVKTEDGWDRLEYTVDDLAFELAKQNRHQENRKAKIMEPARSRIVERFKKKLPDLYGQVQGKIEEKNSFLAGKQISETNDSESESAKDIETANAISSLPEISHQVEHIEADERLILETPAPLTSPEERASSDGYEAKYKPCVNAGQAHITATAKETEGLQTLSFDDPEPLDHAEYEQMGAALQNSEKMRDCDLDSMIEDFLTSKIQTLSSEAKEQNQSSCRRDRILTEMKKRRANSNKHPARNQACGAEGGQCTQVKDDSLQNNVTGSQRSLSSSSVLDAAQPPTVTKLKPPNHANEKRTIPRRCGDLSREQRVSAVPDAVQQARDSSAATLALGAGGVRKKSDEKLPPDGASQISLNDNLRCIPSSRGYHKAPSEPSSIFRFGPSFEDRTSMVSTEQGSKYQSFERADKGNESCALSTTQDTLQGSCDLEGASLLVNQSLTSRHSSETGWNNEERTLNDFFVEKGRSVVEKIRSKRLSRAAIYASSDPGVRGDSRYEDFDAAASHIVSSFRSEAGIPEPANEISSARRAAVVAYLRDRCISPFAAQPDDGTKTNSPQEVAPSDKFYAMEESSLPSQFRDLASLPDSVSDNRLDNASYLSNDFVRNGVSAPIKSDVGAELTAYESVTPCGDAEERALLDEYVRQRTAILKLISPTNHADLSFDGSENVILDEQTTMTASATASQYDPPTNDENQGNHESESGTLTGSVEGDLADFLTRGTHLEIKTKMKKKKNKQRSRDSTSSSFVPLPIDTFSDHLETLHEASNEASDASPRDKGDPFYIAHDESSPWKINRNSEGDLENVMPSDTWSPSSTMRRKTPPTVKSAGSFCDSELSARDLLSTLSPPSPESPIRDYVFFNNAGSVAASESATAGDDVAPLKRSKNKKHLVVVTTTNNAPGGGGEGGSGGGGAITECSSISESVSTFQPQGSYRATDTIQRQLADKFLEVSIDPSGKQRKISPNSVSNFVGGDTAPLESIVDDHDSRNDLFFVDEEDEEYANNSSFIGDTDIIDGRFFEI